MITRRDLLKHASLLSLAPTVPAFLRSAAQSAEKRTERVLVVLQLSGGNDGINTVIPFADEGYARARKALRVPDARVLKVNDSVGLHPSLKGLSALLERNQLAIVQGVSYPNPDRSHDVSMAIWHTARFDREEHAGFGWLGRALDEARPPRQGVPAALLCGGEAPPGALRARCAVVAAMNDLEDYARADLEGPDPARGAGNVDTEDYVRRIALDARATARELQEVARAGGAGERYPTTELARRMQLIAQLMRSGLETPIYYTMQPGYDTHILQESTHGRLLSELGDAVQAFFADLQASGLHERVLLMTFSEFGRRVEENASYGTDHGTSAPMFLAGPAVRPGLHGATPSLLDLEDGDLKMSVDFRRVYATALEQWLGVRSAAALNGDFEKLPLLKT